MEKHCVNEFSPQNAPNWDISPSSLESGPWKLSVRRNSWNSCFSRFSWVRTERRWGVFLAVHFLAFWGGLFVLFSLGLVLFGLVLFFWRRGGR